MITQLAPKKSALRGSELKTSVQNEVVQQILTHKKVVVEAFTGFGKSRIGTELRNKLEAILGYPPKTIIVVPGGDLKRDWEMHMNGIPNVRVTTLSQYTVNESTIVETCDLLIIDEAHRALNQESEYFSKAALKTENTYGVVLSGSLNAKHKSYVTAVGYTTIYTISKYWGYKHDLIPQYHIINIPIDLTLDEKVTYVNAQEELDKYLRLLNGYGLYNIFGKVDEAQIEDVAAAANLTKGQVYGILHKARNNQRIRANILYNAENKLQAATKLLAKVNEKVFVFCRSIDFADKLATLDPLAVAYHNKSKNKSQIWDNFMLDITPHLVTVNKIKEGINVKEVRLALRTSSTSSDIDTEQIIGRVIRLDEDNPNKEAILVSFYMQPFRARGGEVYSQEKNWLVSAQKRERNPIWIDTLDQGIELITKILYG